MFTIKMLSKSYYAYVECNPHEEFPDGHVLLVDGVNNICTLDAFITIKINSDDDIEYILDNADDIFDNYQEGIDLFIDVEDVKRDIERY